MKRVPITFSIIIILSLCLTACIPFTPVPANQQVSEAFIKTAVAGTLTSERAKEAGASLSFTATPDGTPDPDVVQETQETDEVEDPGDGENQDPQPTPVNPWMLQSWCVEHEDDCVKYDVQNRTDSWLQVELKETDTGVTGFFSIRKRLLNEITLIPGKYTVKYTWWCDEEPSSMTVVKALGSWIDVFKCPQGFDQKINKQ
jgi:hypothetical protein